MAVFPLTQQDRPATYALGLDRSDGRPALVLRIRQTIFEPFVLQLPECPLIPTYRNRFHLSDFVHPFRSCQAWGFSIVAIWTGESSLWQTWHIPLPGRIIPGQPTRTIASWAAAGTLQAAFATLNCMPDPRDGPKQMLLVRDLDFLGSRLDVECSPAFRNWCRYAFHDAQRQQTEAAMETAWLWMREGDDAGIRWSVSCTPDGYISLSDGQDCALMPDIGMRYAHPPQGYRWTARNVDRFDRLFTLLAGLAQLGDLASAEDA